MKTIEVSIDNIIDLGQQYNVGLGFFDGLHIGHQALIKSLFENGKKTAILTLSSSYSVFKKIKEEKYLTSKYEKKRILDSFGVDLFLILKVDDFLFNLSYQDFIEKVLLPLNANYFVVGEDYFFGKNRLGNASIIQKLNSKNKIVLLLYFHNEKISTTNIIKHLKEGNIEVVNSMLGRNYLIEGKMIKGYQNGRKFNFPTINVLCLKEIITPKFGVYFGYLINNGQKYCSVINYGTHPSIDELDYPIFEAHILDSSFEILEDKANIELCCFDREERSFSSLEDLRNEIKCSVERGKNFFNII